VQWIGAKNDYSYGMYLYGFLIQQLTAYLGWYQWGYWPWTLACVVLTAGCAWLSWHGIEKRALALKDRGPGRGVAYWLEQIRGRLRGKARSATQEPQGPTGVATVE
jgi:peptidoglycan/LPS O-acetylase OafA/YrhL